MIIVQGYPPLAALISKVYSLPLNVNYKFTYDDLLKPTGPMVTPNFFGPAMSIGEQHASERVLQYRGAMLVCIGKPSETVKRSLLPRHALAAHSQFNSLNNMIGGYLASQLWQQKTKGFHGSGKIMCFDPEEPRPIMLVGEKINPNSEYNDYAFSDPSGSSRYLHEALAKTKYASRIYLTNALKCKDLKKNQARIRQELKLIKPAVVISLGRTADSFLTALGIHHHYVNHPQHTKRFAYHKQDAYAKTINTIIAREDTCRGRKKNRR